jgi:hypothetical protein
MIKVVGDLFTYPTDWICIPTNGVVNKDGLAVMGKGVAEQAKRLMPNLPNLLGRHLEEVGNVPAFLCRWEGKSIYNFPTKNHWKDSSTIDLVADSAILLHKLWKESIYPNIPQWMPRVLFPYVGCGCGQLSWAEVEILLNHILPEDHFMAIEQGTSV